MYIYSCINIYILFTLVVKYTNEESFFFVELLILWHKLDDKFSRQFYMSSCCSSFKTFIWLLSW